MTAAPQATSHRRGIILNSASIAAIAVGSALQTAIYLGKFGTSARTDGVIASIAVYAFIAAIGLLLRTTAVPLLTGPRPAMNETAFGWAIFAIVAAVTVVCEVGARQLAGATAHAPGAVGQSTATVALRIMAPAISLQIAAAALSVHGAIRHRMELVAKAYIASSVAGIVGFFALEGPAGVQVLSYTNVISAVVVAGVLLIGLRVRPTRPPSFALVGRACTELLHTVALPSSFLLMYPLTLALMPHLRGGTITLLGLAFTCVAYVSGFTAQALSMSDVVALTRGTRFDAQHLSQTAARAFRVSLLVAAPVLAIGLVAGGAVIGGLLPSWAHNSGVSFGTDVALLAPWLLATLGVWAAIPAVLAAERNLAPWQSAVVLAVLLTIHISATVLGRTLGNFDGTVLAMAAAPLCFVLVGLATTTAGPRLLVGPLCVVMPLVLVTFGSFSVPLGLLTGRISLPDAVLSAVGGTLAYAVGAYVLMPDLRRGPPATPIRPT